MRRSCRKEHRSDGHRLTRAGVALLWLVAPGAPAGAEDPEIVEVEITASRFEFEPAAVEVERGDHVRLILRSADVTHGLAIEAFDVEVKIPKGGEAVTAEFLARRAGRFPFECSEFCGPGHRKMRGELVVRAPGEEGP